MCIVKSELIIYLLYIRPGTGIVANSGVEKDLHRSTLFVFNG